MRFYWEEWKKWLKNKTDFPKIKFCFLNLFFKTVATKCHHAYKTCKTESWVGTLQKGVNTLYTVHCTVQWGLNKYVWLKVENQANIPLFQGKINDC